MFRMIAVATLIFTGQLALALEVGDKAPQVVGRDISNGLFALSRMAAKPKVLNFFWVDCKPCKKDIT